MAAAVIDRARVLLLFQHTVKSALAAYCDVKRSHETPANGNPKPAVTIIGTSRFTSPERRKGGLSGGECDEASGTFLLTVHDRVEGQSDTQCGAEDALSLLRKHCTERRIDNTVAIGTSPNQMAAAGHMIHLGEMRDEMDYDPTNPRDRFFGVEIDFRVWRSADDNNGGNGLLVEE